MNSARENHRIFGSSPPPTQQPHACVWPALRQLLDKTQKPSVKTRRPLARPTRWRQRPPPPPRLESHLTLTGLRSSPPPPAPSRALASIKGSRPSPRRPGRARPRLPRAPRGRPASPLRRRRGGPSGGGGCRR